jgi:2-C-methyl-D-erythritol 4-phosphate cytidylyltransferase
VTTAAVVLGAGSGQRFGGDKIFAMLAGKPVLAHSVGAFERCPRIDRIVLVLHESMVDRGKELIESEGWLKTRRVCRGGARRQDSVLAGIRAAEADIVLIHDAARPILPIDMIERGIDSVQATGAAIAALPVKDTIKRVDIDWNIVETVDRSALWAAQTPQVFRSHIIERALELAGDVTDDAAALEKLGFRVQIFPGDERAFKITTAFDLDLAENLLARSLNE